jgi:hypothetical protein
MDYDDPESEPQDYSDITKPFKKRKRLVRPRSKRLLNFADMQQQRYNQRQDFHIAKRYKTKGTFTRPNVSRRLEYDNTTTRRRVPTAPTRARVYRRDPTDPRWSDNFLNQLARVLSPIERQRRPPNFGQIQRSPGFNPDFQANLQEVLRDPRRLRYKKGKSRKISSFWDYVNTRDNQLKYLNQKSNSASNQLRYITYKIKGISTKFKIQQFLRMIYNRPIYAMYNIYQEIYKDYFAYKSIGKLIYYFNTYLEKYGKARMEESGDIPWVTLY